MDNNYPLAGHIVLLNAPAGAGKDTVAEYLCNHFGCLHRSFKAALFEVAQAISGTTQAQWDVWYTREGKEMPREELGGLSPRDYLIWASEVVVKPRHGQQHFGKIAAKGLDKDNLMRYGYVFSDSGFDEEVQPLIDKFGIDRIKVIQFTGQGKTNFAGDSRNFLTRRDGLAIMTTTNDDSVERIANDIVEFVNGFLI
jgi:hypothetical protein